MKRIINSHLDVSRIHGLCFDIDGTLSDSDDQLVERLVRWLRPINGILPRRDPRRAARWLVMQIETPGNYFYEMTDRAGIDGLLIRISKILRKLRRRKRPSRFLLIPGSREALERLKEHYVLSVVSARDRDSTLAFLDQFGLTDHFQCVATSQTCPRTKPHPDPVRWAAEQMGLPPEACLMIGDTTVDIRAGRDAGAQTVGVLSGFGEEDELRRQGADLILGSVRELEEALGGRKGKVNR